MARKTITIEQDLMNDLAANPVATKFPLSSVEHAAPETLAENPLNAQYFQIPNDYQKLKEDIAERGVLTPLILRGDGVLLSGHSRLRAARELKLKKIPVLRVLRTITFEEETEFLIKDNLLRRQLTGEQRIELYKKLYPDFESVFLSDDSRQGRKPNGALTIAKIASDTGQNANTVKSQIQKIKRENLKGGSHPLNSENEKNGAPMGGKRKKDGIRALASKSSKSNPASRVAAESQEVLAAKKLVAKLKGLYDAAPPEEQKKIRAITRAAIFAG